MEIKIESLLKQLNIPFAYEEYEGKASTYITYAVLNGNEKDYTDDENNTEVYIIAIHFWTENLFELQKWEEIKELFKKHGYKYIGFTRGKDEGFKGKLMQFEYTNYIERTNTHEKKDQIKRI